MLLKDLINHFNIKVNLPEYLLDESFNDVFLKGDLSKNNNTFKIVAETQKNVTHTMIIKPDSSNPLIIMSELPNGALNGIKFGMNKDDLTYINEF